MTFEEFEKKVVKEIFERLYQKQNLITFDTSPTSKSLNPVTSDGIKTYIDNNIKKLMFVNIEASNWKNSETYKDFPYECILTCRGVTRDLVIDVIFDVVEATSGNYAPVCLSGTDSVTIYSKVNTSITIPVIKEI